jgi:hypothetical protein
MDAFRIVADEKQHFGCRIRFDAVCLDQRGCTLLCQLLKVNIVCLDFLIKREPASGYGSQACLGRGRCRNNMSRTQRS